MLRRAAYIGTVGAASLCAVSVSAQTVDDNSVPQTSLNVPQGLTVFGDNDPNVRRATAVVNGQIITGTDIDQRYALLVSSNEAQLSAEERQSVRLRVFRDLIDEKLQIQAAEANEVAAEDAVVEQQYTAIARENFGQDKAGLDNYLVGIGSSPASLKQQIRANLAWSNLRRRNITPFVNVSDEEVNDIIKRLEESKGVEEYRIGEIYLSATPDNAAEVAENAKRIIEQIRQGGSFTTYARQFSEATTASVGGDLGFVRLETLPTEMAATARQMQAGQLVGPLQIPGGFVILYLIDKRQILTADPRDAVLSLKQLSISFPENITEEQATARAQQFAQATQQIRGCGDADRVAAQIGAAVVDNDNVKVRTDIPAALQDIVLKMSIGETTQPFGSIEQGVRVLVLCGRDDPTIASGPSFDTIMQNVEAERIEKRSEKYLRDLRRDAVIDYN